MLFIGKINEEWYAFSKCDNFWVKTKNDHLHWDKC